MQMRWQINQGERRYQLNFASYSSLFVNHTMNEEKLIQSLIDFFQSRSKIKNSMSIKDIDNDFDDINHHSFTAFELSSELLNEETNLGAKSILKAKLKQDFLNHIETDGYILTINTLAHDLLNSVVEHLPVKMKNMTIDTLLKLFEIDFDPIDMENGIISRNKMIIDFIIKYLDTKHNNPLVLFFLFPELYLSPKEQIQMKEYLIDISEKTHIFVITSSKYFMTNNILGNNYFSYDKQLLTDEFFEDLEWESPLPYSEMELIQSTQNIIKHHVDAFELTPSISNYKQADIISFNSIDLYVLVFILNKLGVDYQLDLDYELIEKPVSKYLNFRT